MKRDVSRRHVVGGLAAGAAITIAAPNVWAQGTGLLAKLRAAKKVRVGLANQPPFSGITPDGKLIGMSPTLCQTIMTRLGVPEMEGTVATYGELVPGMQAGRWDFIAASLTITKARCAQVAFSDPILFDGGSIVSLKGAIANPPKTVAELIARKFAVGVQSGGNHSRVLLAAGIDPANMLQFSSDVSIIDGLVAKRIQVAFASSSGMKNTYRKRKLEVDMTFPVADDPVHGSACAFRQTDTDLYAAFQEQLGLMKKSGEWQKLAASFGFDIPADMANLSAQQLCVTAKK